MALNKRTGVLICGHGSRENAAAQEFLALVREIALQAPGFLVEPGFLEFNTPDIASGLDTLRQAGCREILAIPGTLFAASHTRKDIPLILRQFAHRFPEIDIRYGRELGADERMAEAACARVREAMEAHDPLFTGKDTALLLAARGASDPEAITNIRFIATRMAETFGFPFAQCAYSGLAQPLFEPALEQLAAKGHAVIVVMPYFLSGGKLVKQIYGQMDAAAARYPSAQFVKASCLGHHPLVITCFAERIIEAARTGIRIHA